MHSYIDLLIMELRVWMFCQLVARQLTMILSHSTYIASFYHTSDQIGTDCMHAYVTKYAKTLYMYTQ